MTYCVKVERVGKEGTPRGTAVFFEACSEVEAATIAAYEVDAHPSRAQRIATVFSPMGLLMFVYAGRVQDNPDWGEPATHGLRLARW